MDVIIEKASKGVVSRYADDLCSHARNHGKLKGKILELEGCTKKQGFKSQYQKNNSDGKRVGRRTIQKHDRFTWSLWEKSHGQFSVVHKMWKLDSWQMCKTKESYRWVGNAFCALEMQRNNGRNGEFDREVLR